jgi:hypothetical protein
MSRTNLHTLTGRRSADRSDAVPPQSGPHDPRDPWLRLDAEGAVTFPRAGRPGHGCTAVLRRQPELLAEGRMEGGYSGAFELICCDCGDNPCLDYSQVSPRLQRIRGPYTMAAGLAAYEQHLGFRT